MVTYDWRRCPPNMATDGISQAGPLSPESPYDSNETGPLGNEGQTNNYGPLQSDLWRGGSPRLVACDVVEQTNTGGSCLLAVIATAGAMWLLSTAK